MWTCSCGVDKIRIFVVAHTDGFSDGPVLDWNIRLYDMQGTMIELIFDTVHDNFEYTYLYQKLLSDII